MLKLTGALIGCLALLVLMGTAGASDLGTITDAQLNTQTVIGLLLLGASAAMVKVAERREEVKSQQKMKRR